MRNIFRIFIISVFFVSGLVLAVPPAKSFYFELPQIFKAAIQTLRANQALAQDGVETQPIISPIPTPADGSQQLLQPPQLQPQPFPSDSTQPAPNNNPQPSTCLVNGVEQQGGCDQWNQPNGTQDGGEMGRPTDKPKNFKQREGQQEQGQREGQQGPENMRGPDNARILKDIKRGAQQVARQLKQFEAVVARFEKKGVVISSDIKTKIEELKTIIEKFLSATADEAMDLDMSELGQKMGDLEEERRNLEQMDNIIREMRRIERNVKIFEKQVQKLAKQNVAVPAAVSESLEKVKAAITDIKAGKMENAENIFDLMRDLDENRGQLEMLARWPQTVKEMDNQVKNLERKLKRSKLIVDRLNKKGIDLSAVYSQFESAVAKIKETRDAAKAKIQESAEDAFDMVQNDFFGQMDDVMENQRTIMIMSNFGRFQSDFARETNKAAQQIKTLKRQKIDTIELEDLLAQAKTKGAEVKGLFNVKPLDVDAVIEALGEVENLKQEFDNKMAELTGAEDQMPWEKGPQQFKRMEVSPNLDKWIPRQSQNGQGNGGSGGQGNSGPGGSGSGAGGQTCNKNGVEVPGACQQ